ncbi:DUF2585 family protein [Halovulum sp. GXIMD14793]
MTVVLNYYGECVITSVAAMAAGFWRARWLPVWLSVAIALIFEISTTWMIRDELTLNVLMLLWPLDAVREWQAAI